MLHFRYEAWFQVDLLSYGSKLFASVLAGLLVLSLSSCATHEKTTQENAGLHVVIEDTSSDLTTAFAPVFVLSDKQEPYNRIGRVVADKIDGYEKITIDSDRPVVYAGKFSFSTLRSTYVNLIYRVHFQ